MGVKRRIHTPLLPVPSFPSSPSPSDVWSWQLGGFRIPDPSPPPRGRYIAGADATGPAARHSLREGRSAGATGGAGGRCSGGGAGAAAAPGPGRAWAPGGARQPSGSGAEWARRLQRGPGPRGAASARGFCTVGASARWGRPGRAGWGARAAGTWDDRPRAGGARGAPEPAAPRGGSRSPGTPSRSSEERCSSVPSREAPGSRWLSFDSCPGTGGSVRSWGSQGAPSVSLPRAPPPSVCREVLSSGGGEGG